MDPITASVASIIGLVIFIVTVVSIVRNPNRGILGKVLWIIVVLVLNLIGSILWFVFGRGRVNR